MESIVTIPAGFLASNFPHRNGWRFYFVGRQAQKRDPVNKDFLHHPGTNAEVKGMAYPDEGVVQTWLDALKELDVHVKKMFGCYCVYCDNQPVGWLSEGSFSLREVGLPYLPGDLKRPSPEDKIQEIVIPLDDCNCEWFPKAVQDTANIRKAKANP